MSFRKSEYIDFDAGIVLVQPMALNREYGPRSGQTLTQMLKSFECRVDVWQFGPATAMLREMEAKTVTEQSVWRHSGYGLLAMTLTYFEMIGKILNPESKPFGSASEDFDHGFRDVYPLFEGSDDVRQFRNRVRNGVYHLGYTKSHLYIHNQPERYPDDFMVQPQGEEIYYLVNPHNMTRTIVSHFPSLMSRLKNQGAEFDSLRTKFRQFYDDFHAVPSERR